MPTNRGEALLTQQEAQTRSALIAPGLDYRVFIDFDLGTTYRGLAEILFELKGQDPSSEVFLD